MSTVLDALISRAPHSSFYRRCLSLALQQVVPFNSPHRLSLAEFSEGRAVVDIPFCWKNKNHLGTIHACVMAAAGEYAAGLAIISLVSPTKFRVIIRDLHVSYFLQGREPLTARCELGETTKRVQQFSVELAAESLEVNTLSEILDGSGQLCATVSVIWQLKVRA